MSFLEEKQKNLKPRLIDRQLEACICQGKFQKRTAKKPQNFKLESRQVIPKADIKHRTAFADFKENNF